MRDAIGTVLQIQNFWANSENVTEAEFRSFADSALDRSPILADLHVVDLDLVVKWSSPRTFAEGTHLGENHSWNFLTNVSWADTRPVLAQPPELIVGDPGFVLVAPLRLEGADSHSGFVIAELPCTQILHRMFPASFTEDFHLTLLHDGSTFEAGPGASSFGPTLEAALDFTPNVRSLAASPVMVVRPTPRHAESLASDVPESSALAGVVVAVAAAGAARSQFRKRSEHAHVEARVRASEAHYRKLFENAGEAILVIEGSGRIIRVNPRGQQMLGRGASDATPLMIESVCLPGEAEGLRDRLRAVLASGRTQPFAGRLLNGENSSIDVFGALSMTGEGDESTVIACLVDVTRLRQLEDQLRMANQSLATKVAELDLFAHTVAHDLRSPLRAIQVYADDLVEDNEAALSEAGREQLARITENVESMRVMLEALLQYARAGGDTGEPEPVAVGQIVESVRQEIAPLLAASKARLIVDGSLPEVLARPIPLTQVFANLITNAIKHNDHPRPEVRVNAERDGAKGWAFTVTDNGPGIPDPEKERVFELFSRGALADSEGSGVGLAIVRRIIESHGGVIAVGDSREGGAAFRFTLPDAPAMGVRRHDAGPARS